MNRFSSPYVWIARFRHRCGYGIHSPFAFRFVTDVIYEELPYYAYARLDRKLPLPQRFRTRKCLHLFFRISNWLQPNSIACPDASDEVMEFLHEGCRKASISQHLPEGPVDLCYLTSPDETVLPHLHAHSVLLMDNLRQHHEWFRHLPAVVTFDLYDIGIAFFDPKYNRQHYIINF